MATRTKKSTQPQPAAPPPTDDEIEARLRGYAAEERTKVDTLKAQFFDRAERSATFAIEGLGSAIVEQEAEAEIWGIVERWLDRDDAPFADRLASALTEVRENQDRILAVRLWEANSSSAFSNVARMHLASGRVRGLEMIAVHVGVAIKQLEARDQGGSTQ